ncbi:MAG: transglycosylase domain-containing protein, partial [Kofleriaceae bacterium]|nr:transglycosylase domain-containing protein [Kofleriaceae bacterium]
ALAKEGSIASVRFESAVVQPGAGPRLTLGESILRVDPRDALATARFDVSNGAVKLWQGMTLTGISGQVAPGDDLQELIVDLGGSYGGSTEKLWHAQGWLNPKARRGQLDVKADRFTLNRISGVLQDTVLRDFDDTSVDAELSIEVEDGKADISGRLDLTGLSFFHEKLSEDVIENLSFEGEVMASFDSVARTMKVLSMSVVTKGVTYKMSGEVALEGGLESDGSVREFPRLTFQGTVPVADCQAVLDSIPAPILPKLQGFRLRGPFSAAISLAIDWSDLDEKTKLDWTINLPQCKVLSPAAEFSTTRLMTGFTHQILVGPAQFESVEIGMASPNYVQIFDVSPYFLNAVLTHEDSRFYDHKGFISREFRSALISNLKAKTFKRGASSITMQMVKNVFLYRDKTMSRKLQELFLTWYVERTLEKNRIFEIYVNAIEYGPGVYGIMEASRIYFDKHPRDLEPLEAAFLGQLLPAPRRRYFEYCKDKLSKRSKKKIERLLGHMNRRNRLSDEDFEDAKNSEIEFNPVKERELCKKLPSW